MRRTLTCAILFLLAAPANGQLRPVTVRCEYDANPLGIETPRPRLSWVLESVDPTARGQRQTAYSIEAASSPQLLATGRADLWRTGAEKSDRQFGIEYAGKPLHPRDRCWWRVKVWDERNRASGWSEPQCWEMGMLAQTDWTAEWIGAPEPPVEEPNAIRTSHWVWLPGVNGAVSAPAGVAAFRTAFDLDQSPTSAELDLLVDNTCRVWVNGREAGGAAGWQRATRLDISSLLRPGRNTIAILAENGGPAPNPAGLAGALMLHFGRRTELAGTIGPGWKVAEDPPAGWQSVSFDDNGWSQAHVFAGVGAAPWGLPAAPHAPSPPAPLFRKPFSVPKAIRRARAYVCGLGYYELYLNGRKVADRVLEPAQTDYEQRAFYTAYDVTSYLRRGANAAGIMLGNGWFNQDRVWGGLSYGRPRAICQIEVEYTDGSHLTVGTDKSWQTKPGPVLSNNIYAGEVFDARRETAGWCLPNGDRGWSPVEVLLSPTRRLMSTTLPPIRRIKTMRPVRITRPVPGVAIYDMGQNFAGWARLRVRAKWGAEVRMRFAETLDAKGRLDTASTGVFATDVEQIDRYICKGVGEETWEPRFTYHGFRYVEVTGLPDPRPENITGVVVHTDMEPIGTFTCSDPMLNRLHKAALWTELSNLHGHPTDCPARERCGWLGDAQITAEMTMCNWDMARFWPKYLGDILTSWRGERPGDVAPGKRGSEPNGHVDWGLAVVLIPWYQYLYYGDERTLREIYPHMARFVRSVAKTAKDGIIENGYGDWCPPGSVEPTETPPSLTTTAWFYRAAEIVSHAASVTGRVDDAREFASLADATRKAFNKRFAHGTNYGSQTANAMALCLGLADNRPGAAASLRDNVTDHIGHLSTGIFGSRFLFDALCSNGLSGVALRILHQTTYPSYGDLFAKGATTLWECWGEPELDRKWGARSLNHPMQGGFDAWFYQGLGGINSWYGPGQWSVTTNDPGLAGHGFRRFVLRPQFMDGLTWANVTYRSASGNILSRWKRTGPLVEWEVTVPPNSSAIIQLDSDVWNAGRWTESGKPIRKGRGVLEYANDGIGKPWFRIGSGTYQFHIQRRPAL